MVDTATTPTEAIFAAFKTWIAQRPGLEFGNYGDRRAYASELRSINKAKEAANKALREAQTYPFNPQAMADALTGSFSGRLSWTGTEFDYTTGQYWPTEYRAAAQAVLESYCHSVRPKVVPTPNQRFTTISDLKAANEDAGGFWFSRGNMKFARSRIHPGLYHGKHLIWFVSSEARGFRDESRMFTVRVFDPKDASVGTVGEFGQHRDLADARADARDLAKRDLAGLHITPTDQQTKCEFCGHYAYYCTENPRKD